MTIDIALVFGFGPPPWFLCRVSDVPPHDMRERWLTVFWLRVSGVVVHDRKDICCTTFGVGFGVTPAGQQTFDAAVQRSRIHCVWCRVPGLDSSVESYRSTSLLRNCPTLGTYSRLAPRALWWSWGGGCLLMSEVPLYPRTTVEIPMRRCSAVPPAIRVLANRFFETPDLYHRSPDSSDLWYKSGPL